MAPEELITSGIVPYSLELPKPAEIQHEVSLYLAPIVLGAKSVLPEVAIASMKAAMAYLEIISISLESHLEESRELVSQRDALLRIREIVWHESKRTLRNLTRSQSVVDEEKAIDRIDVLLREIREQITEWRVSNASLDHARQAMREALKSVRDALRICAMRVTSQGELLELGELGERFRHLENEFAD